MLRSRHESLPDRRLPLCKFKDGNTKIVIREKTVLVSSANNSFKGELRKSYWKRAWRVFRVDPLLNLALWRN